MSNLDHIEIVILKVFLVFIKHMEDLSLGKLGNKYKKMFDKYAPKKNETLLLLSASTEETLGYVAIGVVIVGCLWLILSSRKDNFNKILRGKSNNSHVHPEYRKNNTKKRRRK